MPSINVAMERSLERGFKEGLADLLARSLEPVLARRNLEGQISDVRTTFASWDNCMSVTYCKWTVIGLMIVGGLIIFSIIWCIIRCACCGRSCCCSCFSCFKCCGNCCGCCDPPRGNRKEYLDEPYIPPNQGYKSQDPMHHGYNQPAGFGGGGGGGVSPGFPNPTVPITTKAEYPQFAEFDVSKKNPGGEDALPQMPEWDSAGNKKVLLEQEDAVEMNALKKPEESAHNAPGMNGVAASAIPGAVNKSPSPGNRSPYGPPAAGANGFFPPSAVGNAPYSQSPQGYNDPYSQTPQGYNQPPAPYDQQAQGYGVAASAMGPVAMGAGAVGPGRRSPHADGGFNNGYNNTGGYRQPGVNPQQTGQSGYGNYGGAAETQPYDIYDDYGAQDNYGGQSNQAYGVQNNQGYGAAPRQLPQEMDGGNYNQGQARRSPGPQAAYGGYGQDARRTPAPQGDGGYGANARRTPAPQGDYGNGYGASPRKTPAPQGDYGSPYGADAQRSPPTQGGYSGYGQDRRSPAPQQAYGGYGSRQNPSRQNTSDSAQPPRGPQRQYTGSSMNPTSPTALRNEGGFDFTSGYSRPPQANTTPSGPGGYRQPSPVTEEATAAYPGYKPYQPLS
ncbi:hypothetical protein QBC35DRAFT_103812 [Podospora australis]|uniref:Fibroin-3 related protein n=1 Tax=Podospora australis TaxID=1536484 RepID=A0AAN6X5D5_9PEZI|nr:hypothetical protein QBC35DRAFT_103812 [Podospora australis]